jgi:pyruvate/oxaloacetate carboxyltransferase
MAHIILNAEQVQVLEGATTAVEIRDPNGRVVAHVPAPTEQEIVERIQRERNAHSARFPADQVERRLQRLEAIRQQEGMDQARMRELLRRMRAVSCL